MSPEQARGEGHRVDGRTDIFSLGVVLYELLTGRRPFQGESIAEVLEQITTTEARPPRQIDDTIPKELERICLKAMSSGRRDRYTTAGTWRKICGTFSRNKRGTQAGRPIATSRPQLAVAATGGSAMPRGTMPAAATAAESRHIKIVPKGLRSFDEHDADFFLELLPGPRDRDGLPDSIRFWKTQSSRSTPTRPSRSA